MSILTESKISDTEKKIEAYYKNVSEIQRLDRKLEVLYLNRELLQKDIEESHIILDVSIRGINYSDINVKSFNKSSEQERAIESAFIKLETQKSNINREIFNIKLLRRELIISTVDMETKINSLEEKDKEFIEMRYKNKMSYNKICMYLHISPATIGRMKKDIIYVLSNL